MLRKRKENYKWTTDKDLVYSIRNSAQCVWQPGWERGLAEKGDIYMYGLVPSCPHETIMTLLISYNPTANKVRKKFFLRIRRKQRYTSKTEYSLYHRRAWVFFGGEHIWNIWNNLRIIMNVILNAGGSKHFSHLNITSQTILTTALKTPGRIIGPLRQASKIKRLFSFFINSNAPWRDNTLVISSLKLFCKAVE